MRSNSFTLIVANVAILLLAGCVTGDAGLTADSTSTDDPDVRGRPADNRELPAHITGVIIDTELIPIPEADVVVTPGDNIVLTAPDGTFAVGPLEPGDYTVSASKSGYATKEQQVTVTADAETKVRLTLEPVASDVPYHETFSEAMYLICHLVIANNAAGITILNAPCGAIDLVAGTTNSLDHWIFFFTIDKPGFKSLVMEMVWDPQQFGHDGLMQLSTEGRVESSGTGATVAGSVYGETMGPPFHDVIHAGNNYWGDGTNKDRVFYPEPNSTEEFKMLIAGGGDNTTLGGSAVFVEFRPTAYLTFFYNRQATPEFTILPPE